jgi:hypothetical protein
LISSVSKKHGSEPAMTEVTDLSSLANGQSLPLSTSSPRALLLLSAVLLIFSLQLVSCGGGNNSAPPPPSISVSIAPSPVNVQAGIGAQQFTATVTNTTNTAVTWQVNGVTGGNATVGTISASGLYTAPASVPNPAAVTVSAISVADPSRSGNASVTVTAPISVSVAPTSKTLNVGKSQQFTATVTNDPSVQGVTWRVSGVTGGNATVGTISASGLYTAPAAVPNPAIVSVTAVSVRDPSRSAAASVTILPAISVSVAPNAAGVPVSTQKQFTAAVQNDFSTLGVSWTLSGAGCLGSACGTLTSVTTASATYNAPGAVPNPATVSLTATSLADNTKTGTATITVVTSPTNISLVLTPNRGGLTVSQSLAFTAVVTGDTLNQGVVWSSTGGTLSNQAAFTASFSSATAGAFAITAKSVADSTKSASATIGVTDLQGIFSWRGMEGDNTRQGVNSKEYALTPSNVSGTTFGKLFSCPVDGFVFAQPLYFANLAIPGKGTHNVVFVATEKDIVYAFDADSNANPCVPLWQKTLVPLGESVVSAGDLPCSVLGPDSGITGTPVIDPVTQTLYVSAFTKNTAGTQFFHRLHALSLADGAEKFSGPATIQASVPGTGMGSVGGTLSFDSMSGRLHLQRAGLLLARGVVYITWASYCDNMPYHGWVIGYNSSTLQQAGKFTVTPNGSDIGGEGGIWMSGAAPSADASGNIFLSVGNGTFDNITSAIPPVAPNLDFGDSVLKLAPSGSTLAVTDFFTPADQAALNAVDDDLGSAGVVLFSSGTSTFALTGGKNGHIYLFDQANLGRYQKGPGGTDASLQNLSVIASEGFRSTPAFFNNTAYIAGQASPLFAIPFDPIAKLLQTPPYSAAQQSAAVFGAFGPSPVISAAPGASSGIVWILDIGPSPDTPVGPAVLRAYDSSNMSNVLYRSDALVADAAGKAVKFTVPVVANGKVYVGTQTELDVYGLLP